MINTWTCENCTFENKLESDHCEMCNAPRTGAGNAALGAADSSIPSEELEERQGGQVGEEEANSSNDKKARNRLIGGAAVAGGLAGLVIAGPVGLVAAGAGAAYVATTDSKAGDVARASGDVVASAGDRVKDLSQKHQVKEKASTGLQKVGAKAREFDEKHQVIEKTKTGVKKVGDKAREFDEKHQVVEKTKAGVRKAGAKLREFDQKHQISQKTTAGFLKATTFVANKLSPKSPTAQQAATNATV